ncbi:hypothetical protein G3570_00125 [Balneolaceae bacterium YR4-1]|uniref:Uncharacterized protein n=1 Tax=Halalkalibaculum roseum TaxID=2709311 RepID=A0A6M1SQF6_9BACT|nr:hypothetical protein [Halalkalibaculum roseum]NGP75020.1 hypothetical protein [Halalkalibaculum roseum]
MSNHTRVPGGEENKKSGTTWSREEIEYVFKLYRELEGEGIHENNPKIINLGKKLGRTTRSVEAQLYMFRSLERGDYSHSNMNKHTRNIWQEYMEDRMVASKKGSTQNEVRKWAGHRESGVTVAFTKRTKPDKHLVKTRLIKELGKLAQDVSHKKLSDRVGIFLLGGPGNGKTEALNYFFEVLSEQVSSNGDIKELLFKKGEDYKREINIDVSEESDGLLGELKIIQDATVGNEGEGAGHSFLNDLEWLTKEIPKKRFLFVCINRGILQDALQYVKLKNSYSSKVVNLLENINETQHVNPNPINSWPINDNKIQEDVTTSPSLYVWPMERESVFNKPDEHTSSPAQQALRLAYNELEVGNEKFVDFQLDHEGHIENLVELFKIYEVKTGRNISMREWFSLMVQAILGDEKRKEQNNSVWLEAFQQYPSRLFPFYPDLSAILEHQHILEVFKNETSGFLEGFFKDYQSNLPNIGNSEIGSVLESLEEELETGRAWEMDMKILGSDFSYRTFDRKVSTSIEYAEEYLINRKEDLNLSEQDCKLFSHFSKASGILQTMEDTNKALAPHLSSLQNLLRKLFSLYAYRTLSVKNGICIHSESVNEYKTLCSKEGDLHRRNLKNSFKDFFLSNQKLSIDMARTFGQPLNTEREVLTLEVSSNFTVDIKIMHTENLIQPTKKMAFLVAKMNQSGEKSVPLPITYKLFNAMYQQLKGLDNAMVPREVHAQLERLGTEVSQKTLKNMGDFLDIITIKGSKDPQKNEEINMDQLLWNLKRYQD